MSGPSHLQASPVHPQNHLEKWALFVPFSKEATDPEKGLTQHHWTVIAEIQTQVFCLQSPCCRCNL